MTYHLLAISGSLRKGSYNTALLRAWKALAPDGTTVDIVSSDDVRSVPLFDQDLEKTEFPENVAKLKERIRRADGVLISTPEYNRAFSGALKNLLDWTSRPYGDSAWNEKPVFVMGATGGAIGTALAQASLKQVLSYLNARVPGQPEFYLGGANTKFAEDGTLSDESTKEHIQKGYTAFIALIDSFRK